MLDTTRRSFADALNAAGPAPEVADGMALYGRFIGSWHLQAITYPDDGTVRHGTGEVHFAWVLQGRAIQDVWILPGVFYGTTLRVFDPGLDAWRILWNDPVRQVFVRQIGRAQGADIVQEGTDDAGARMRWSFTGIAPRSFRWLGERSADDARTWHVQADFRLTRFQEE